MYFILFIFNDYIVMLRVQYYLLFHVLNNSNSLHNGLSTPIVLLSMSRQTVYILVSLE